MSKLSFSDLKFKLYATPSAVATLPRENSSLQQNNPLSQYLVFIPFFSLSLFSYHPHPFTPVSPSQCDKEIEQVQSQLEEYREPPLSLSRLSLKQQKFKTFRETANVSL